MNNTIFDAALKVMNEGFEADHEAMQCLVDNRVPCNENMANHKTICVHSYTPIFRHEGKEKFSVGMMGILNGIIEELTGKRIAAVVEADGTLSGFVEYEYPKSVNEVQVKEKYEKVGVPFDEPLEPLEPCKIDKPLSMVEIENDAFLNR